jgi:hypothetical protein
MKSHSAFGSHVSGTSWGMTRPLRSGAMAVALMVLATLPCRGSAWYAGMTAGSNGTTYGWAVTEVTSQSVYHEAFVSVTLSSPNGRQDSLDTQSDQNTVREDVSLAFDENDLGDYFTDGTHSAYCDFGEAWLFEEVNSQFSIKIGFQQIQYYWDTLQPPQYGCYYSKNCPPSTGSYCGPSFFTTPQNKVQAPHCYTYDSRRYFFVKVGGALSWWQWGDDYYSDSYWAYPCDAAIP